MSFFPASLYPACSKKVKTEFKKLNKIFSNRLITFGWVNPIRLMQTIHIIKFASS